VRVQWKVENLHVKPGRYDLSAAAHNETADPEQQASIRSSMNLPGRVPLFPDPMREEIARSVYGKIAWQY
jgi:hypothetical protein